MIENDKPNPFEVLGLPTDATNKVVIERTKELSSGLEPEEQLLCRWAREQLITHPFTRLAYELFEVPGTQYEDAEWETFAEKYKRNPIKRAATVEEVPLLCLEDFNLSALIQHVLDGLLAVPEVNLTPDKLDSPFQPNYDALPLEVQDVIFG